MWNKGRKIAINKMHSASLHLPYEGEGGLLMANYGYAKWKIKMCRCSWLGNIGTIRPKLEKLWYEMGNYFLLNYPKDI